MLKAIAMGLLGRLVAYGVFGVGFWFLFRGVQDDNIPLAVLGGAMIPAGLYLLVKVRKFGATPPKVESPGGGDGGAQSPTEGTPEARNTTTKEDNRQ